MATILVLQHGPVQNPCRLGATLRDHGFRLDIRQLHKPLAAGGDPLPDDLDNLRGIVSLGGPQNVDENHWWMPRELELLRQATERGLPVVGICLGQQLLALALGGKVEKMPVPEVGFQRMSLSVPGQTETLLAGVPWSSPQFFSHGYAVTAPPPGATVLASTALSKCAVFRAGLRSIGFGNHFEADRPLIEEIARTSTLMDRAGLTSEELGRQVAEHYAMFGRIADRICVNLASFAFTFEELFAA